MKNAAIRTGVYAGVGMSLIFTIWVFAANRVPGLESVAQERDLAAAAALLLFAVVPVLRFLRMPGHILASSLIGWGILAVTYRLLPIDFWGLQERYSAVQVFTLGAVVYMILATISWIGTCIWRARASDVSHSNRHVS